MGFTKNEQVDCYFKLGPKASMFFDPSAVNRAKKKGDTSIGLKVLPNSAAKFQGKVTARMEIAISNNHIQALTEKEYNLFKTGIEEAAEESKAEEEENVALGDMKKDEIVEYFKSNFEYDEDQLLEFSSLTKAKMIEYIEELE